jgi:hypothetical protein
MRMAVTAYECEELDEDRAVSSKLVSGCPGG